VNALTVPYVLPAQTAERRGHAMPQRTDKRIFNWLTIDLLFIASSLVFIGLGVWVGPW